MKVVIQNSMLFLQQGQEEGQNLLGLNTVFLRFWIFSPHTPTFPGNLFAILHDYYPIKLQLAETQSPITWLLSTYKMSVIISTLCGYHRDENGTHEIPRTWQALNTWRLWANPTSSTWPTSPVWAGSFHPSVLTLMLSLCPARRPGIPFRPSAFPRTPHPKPLQWAPSALKISFLIVGLRAPCPLTLSPMRMFPIVSH